jgi:hypothetical protein
MRKKNLSIHLTLSIIFLITAPLASAQTGTGINREDVARIYNLQELFVNVLVAAGGLIGIAFFAMIVIGGVRYLLSAGDPKALQSAKGTLTFAVVGLALFALSFTILVILGVFTGVDLTRFRIRIY